MLRKILLVGSTALSLGVMGCSVPDHDPSYARVYKSRPIKVDEDLFFVSFTNAAKAHRDSLETKGTTSKDDLPNDYVTEISVKRLFSDPLTETHADLAAAVALEYCAGMSRKLTPMATKPEGRFFPDKATWKFQELCH